MLAQGRLEGGALLHVLAHGGDDLLEALVGLLSPKDLEALHHGQAGIDHDAELPGEDGQFLGLDPPEGLGAPRALGLDHDDLDAITLQGDGRSILGFGDDDAFLDLSEPILPFPCKCGHQNLERRWAVSVFLRIGSMSAQGKPGCAYWTVMGSPLRSCHPLAGGWAPGGPPERLEDFLHFRSQGA